MRAKPRFFFSPLPHRAVALPADRQGLASNFFRPIGDTPTRPCGRPKSRPSRVTPIGTQKNSVAHLQLLKTSCAITFVTKIPNFEIEVIEIFDE